jgi:hypothetical protein
MVAAPATVWRMADDVMLLVGDQLVQGSVYRLLAETCAALFGDEYFADVFKRSTLGARPCPCGWSPR